MRVHVADTPPGRLARLILVMLLAIVGAVLGPASPAEADGKPLVDRIYRELDVDSVPAAYVVLVDTSSSMQDPSPDGGTLYGTVKKRLRTFLGSLTRADRVSVVAFGRAISVVHPMGPVGDVDTLVDRGLPDRAGEPATDLGSALETAAEQLERSTAPVGAVLLLSDGTLNAPGTSYPSLRAPAWKGLKGRYDAMRAERTLIGYGLPLARKTHVSSVLGKVFATPRILPYDPSALGSQLSAAKDQVRARKAATLLREDTGAGVTATLSTGEHGGTARLRVPVGDRTGKRTIGATLTLTSTTEYTPLRVALRPRTTPGRPEVTVTGLPKSVELRAGEKRSFDVRVAWRQDASSGVTNGTDDWSAGLAVTGSVTSRWTHTIRGSIGYPQFRTGRLAGAQLTLEGQVPRRAPVWLYPLLLVVVFAAVAGGRFAYVRRRPRLSGTLTVTDLRSGDRQVLPLSGRVMTVDTDSGGVHARVRVRGRRTAGLMALALDCTRTSQRTGEGSTRDSGLCALEKSTVLCGIGFSHSTDTPVLTPR